MPSEWGTFNADNCIVRLLGWKSGKRWCTIIGDCDLVFTRANGEKHAARVGILSDGASIPWPFHTWPGHPFDKYLEACLVHDQGCRDRKLPAPTVHRILYEGMRALGVNVIKARVIHGAVLARHPYWKVDNAETPDSRPAA